MSICFWSDLLRSCISSFSSPFPTYGYDLMSPTGRIVNQMRRPGCEIGSIVRDADDFCILTLLWQVDNKIRKQNLSLRKMLRRFIGFQLFLMLTVSGIWHRFWECQTFALLSLHFAAPYRPLAQFQKCFRCFCFKTDATLSEKYTWEVLLINSHALVTRSMNKFVSATILPSFIWWKHSETSTRDSLNVSLITSCTASIDRIALQTRILDSLRVGRHVVVHRVAIWKTERPCAQRAGAKDVVYKHGFRQLRFASRCRIQPKHILHFVSNFDRPGFHPILCTVNYSPVSTLKHSYRI